VNRLAGQASKKAGQKARLPLIWVLVAGRGMADTETKCNKFLEARRVMTHATRRRQPASARPAAGFTLIELLIAVAIIGILASIAYPSYTGYVERTRVIDGQSGLMQAAQEMERCYTVSSNYPETGCLVTTSSPDGVYGTIKLTEHGSTFRLEASDSSRVTEGCKTLWIKSNGDRGPSDCW
jgi:type IV pilus assembly protein PilE